MNSGGIGRSSVGLGPGSLGGGDSFDSGGEESVGIKERKNDGEEHLPVNSLNYSYSLTSDKIKLFFMTCTSSLLESCPKPMSKRRRCSENQNKIL